MWKIEPEGSHFNPTEFDRLDAYLNGDGAISDKLNFGSNADSGDTRNGHEMLYHYHTCQGCRTHIDGETLVNVFLPTHELPNGPAQGGGGLLLGED